MAIDTLLSLVNSITVSPFEAAYSPLSSSSLLSALLSFWAWATPLLRSLYLDEVGLEKWNLKEEEKESMRGERKASERRDGKDVYIVIVGCVHRAKESNRACR